MTRTGLRKVGAPGLDKTGVLCFELIGQDEIRASEYLFVSRNDFLVDIKFALVTHHWVEDYIIESGNLFLADLDRTGRLPQKKEPGFMVDFVRRSRPIIPTASTTSALGA